MSKYALNYPSFMVICSPSILIHDVLSREAVLVDSFLLSDNKFHPLISSHQG